MTRVCLCVTGQIRDVASTLQRLREATSDHDVRIIFSIWDRSGRKVDGALNLHQLTRIFDEAAFTAVPSTWHGHQSLWRALPLLRRDLLLKEAESEEAGLRSAIDQHFPDAIVDIESAELLDLEFNEERQDKNSMKMAYKFWRANQIRRKLERNSQPFDLVIRARPDLHFEQLEMSKLIERVSDGEFLVDIWSPDGAWAGDNFCAGTPAEMDVYTSVFARTIMLPLEWSIIHTELARHLTANGLRPAVYPGMHAPVAEERVSAAQLATSLRRQKEEGGIWSLPHSAALAAAVASTHLEAEDVDGALAVLKALAGSDPVELSALDGYIYTLARALVMMGATSAAAACFAVARFWKLEGMDPRRRMAVEALAAAVAPHLDPADPFSPGPVARALLVDFGPAWVAEALPAEHRGQHLERRLFNIFGDALSQLETQVALAEQFAHSGLVDLAVACLDNLALPDTDSLEPDARAAQILRYAVDLVSRNVFFGYHVANDLKEKGRFEEARALQAAALEITPDHGGANRQMAEIWTHLGEYEQARHYASRAVMLQEAIEHKMLLAFIDHRRGQVALAEKAWGDLTGSAVAPAAYSTLPGFDAFRELRAAAAEAS